MKRGTYTVDETVERLGPNGPARATVYKAVHDGQIPSIKIGNRLLIPAAWLDRVLEG